MIDHTKRCQNCGGLKKEHKIKKPYQCLTRLKITYWCPWPSNAAYEEAAEAGSKK